MTTTLSPSESYSITMRLEIQNKVGMLGKVTTAIGEVGGDIGAVDLSGHGKGTVTRDVTARANGIGSGYGGPTKTSTVWPIRASSRARNHR